MKNNLFVLLLFFVLVPFVFSDIGPSPSFSFEVDNLDEYPEYDFYAAGNIYTDLIEEGQNGVYKLNTSMKIVAVEKGQQFDSTGHEFYGQEYVAQSEIIDLHSGESIFSIVGVNTQSKTLSVELKNNTPDVSSFMLVDLVVPAIIGVIVLVVIIVAAVAISSKKKNPKNSVK